MRQTDRQKLLLSMITGTAPFI